MTPYEMARQECANHMNGNCITKGTGCLLGRKPLQPCTYFEEGVLNIPNQPGADKHPRYFDLLDARQKYLDQTMLRTVRKTKIQASPEWHCRR